MTGCPHDVMGKVSPEHAASNAELIEYQRCSPLMEPTQTPAVESPGAPVADTAVIVGARVDITTGVPRG